MNGKGNRKYEITVKPVIEDPFLVRDIVSKQSILNLFLPCRTQNEKHNRTDGEAESPKGLFFITSFGKLAPNKSFEPDKLPISEL